MGAPVTHEQMMAAWRTLGGAKYYTDRTGQTRSHTDLTGPTMPAWFNSQGIGDDVLPAGYHEGTTALTGGRAADAQRAGTALLAGYSVPAANLPPTTFLPAVPVTTAQPAFTAVIGGPSSSSPVAQSLGYLDDGTPFYDPMPDPTGRTRPIRNGQTRAEGAEMTRSELLSRTSDTGAMRNFDLGLGDLPDVTSGIASIINALRPVLGGGRTPPALPPPPGGAVSVGGTIARGGRGLGKIFATLTAAGLTTEAIVALMSSGVIKVPKRKKGITAAQLTGFNKVCNLLGRAGMAPRIRRSPGRKKKC